MQLQQEITEFLTSMGIPPGDQEPAYREEIAYRIGYEDALRNYAIWHDGVQLVGAMQKPLPDVLAEFHNLEVPNRY